MHITITVEGKRAEGKTTFLTYIEKMVEQNPQYSLRRKSHQAQINETLELTIDVDHSKPNMTNEACVSDMIQAAAMYSSDNDGTASMRLSQSAVNVTNAMMNLAALK